MAASLEREEWKAFSDFMALVASGLCALVGLILTVAGKDPVMLRIAELEAQLTALRADLGLASSASEKPDAP